VSFQLEREKITRLTRPLRQGLDERRLRACAGIAVNDGAEGPQGVDGGPSCIVRKSAAAGGQLTLCRHPTAERDPNRVYADMLSTLLAKRLIYPGRVTRRSCHERPGLRSASTGDRWQANEE